MHRSSYSREFKEHLLREHRQSPFSTYLKEIVYGGNDGIVTTFAVVAGFSGAGSSEIALLGSSAVLLFGLANLFADGASMGLGNFLSSRSEKALYDAERKKESREIHLNPTWEKRETLEMLQAEGFSAEDAEHLATLFMKNPPFWTDFMMHYEIQMPPPSAEPFKTASATFIAFIMFGAIPLAPYFLPLSLSAAWTASIISSFLALLLLGIFRAIIIGTRITRSVFETLAVGITAGGIAYLVGYLVG